MNIRYPIYEGVYRILTEKIYKKMKEKYCFLMMERIYVYFLACG